MKKRSPEVQRLRRPGTRRLRLSHSVAKPKRQKSTCLQHLKRQLSTGLRLRESPFALHSVGTHTASPAAASGICVTMRPTFYWVNGADGVPIGQQLLLRVLVQRFQLFVKMEEKYRSGA